MPRLRRMRLVSIGHNDSRYSDVTLKFTNRSGDPTNSVLWLRNGGGKSQLLGLFFAGIRPNKREFLGQRAEEKVRSIDDCVGKRDHGLVVCEWELDAEDTLFDERPVFLTGVFYEWPSKQTDNGKTGVDRLFFSANTSSSVNEMTLEGLPIYNQGQNELHRFHLKGFQRQLKRLDRTHPKLEIFETDHQNKYMAELLSHGIDPEVFRYQISMNEREGGASELFSFSQDSEFVDFVLEMAFSQQKANDVREQLSTFREELVVRNEQLKPEKTYCEGLLTKLTKLASVRRDREVVFADTVSSQRRLLSLKSWMASRVNFLESELKKLNSELAESQKTADDAVKKADALHREAAVNHQHACQIRFDKINAELAQAKDAFTEATRLKNIWSAARPLARSWESRRQSKLNREQLARKQKQFAPDLARLEDAATKLSRALRHEIELAQNCEVSENNAIDDLESSGKKLQSKGQAEGEAAAKLEKTAEQLAKQIEASDSESNLLRTKRVLDENETAEAGQERLANVIESEAEKIASLNGDVVKNKGSQKETSSKLSDVEKSSTAAELHLKALEDELSKAESSRAKIESDAALIRLLHVDRVDIESAAVKAVDAANEELRRITEAILRIRIEAAEDERALDWLRGDGDLLPPSQDVGSALKWLRQNEITAWSGWEYIETNNSKKERRKIIERLPFVATGIVVASKDYDRVVDLSNSTPDAIRLRTAITIVPTEVLTDAHDIVWTVVGPASDAHFDKDAAAVELNQLESHRNVRSEEINEHTKWQQELADLRERLRTFQTTFPRGWFPSQRQKIEVAKAKLSDANENVNRLKEKLSKLVEENQKLGESLEATQQSKNENLRRLDRVDTFIRQFGKHLAKWKRDLEKVQQDAQKHRDYQKRSAEKAEQKLQEAGQRRESATTARLLVKQLEGEVSRVKYVIDDDLKAIAGSTQSLRADYDSLRLEYEDKVNSETLEQMAAAYDADAQKERTEFERVLAQYSVVGESDVERELKQLSEHTSAAVRWEQAEKDENAARARSGNIGNQARPKREDLEAANLHCKELVASGALPVVKTLKSEIEFQQRSDQLKAEEEEHRELALEFVAEITRIEKQLNELNRESEALNKDGDAVESMEINHQELLDRLRRHQPDADFNSAEETANVKDANDLARLLKEIEIGFRGQRTRHSQLDSKRDSEADQISSWSRQKRFTDFAASISHRFLDKRAESLENKSEFFITQLEDRILEIERKLEEANKHHERVVGIVSSAVDEALSLVKRVSRMSKLPDTLPLAGRNFIKIMTNESDNPTERRAKIADLIAEIIQTGDVGDGLSLIQKGVRRVAAQTKVGFLHPDLRSTDRLSVSELKRKSGGERLTCAIMLYCALVKLRQQEGGAKGTSVLFLDNPIGTASRVSFLDLQREVAESMNVQLIYATGVNDLNAVSALENVIRLRNSRVDRRTNRRMVEVEGDGEWFGQVDVARVVFDKPAGSIVQMESDENELLAGVKAHESED